MNRKVFVVHGRNPALKYEIAHTLQNAGLDVTILHEKRNQGRTILENFLITLAKSVLPSFYSRQMT